MADSVGGTLFFSRVFRSAGRIGAVAVLFLLAGVLAVALIHSSNLSVAAASQDTAEARHAVQVSAQINPPDGQGSTVFTIYNVPANRHLTIEYASIQASLPQGQALGLGVLTTVDGQSVIHYVGTASSIPGQVIVQTGQVVQFYADPGTAVQIQWWRSQANGDCTVTAELSGFLTQ